MVKTSSGRIVGTGPQRIIRRGELKAVTGYSIAHTYDLIADGKFPKPIPLGSRAVGWLESDIAEWQAARIAERDAAASQRDAAE